MPICDMAPGLKSWNYIEASIALAAVNAFLIGRTACLTKRRFIPAEDAAGMFFTKFCESHTKDRRTLFPSLCTNGMNSEYPRHDRHTRKRRRPDLPRLSLHRIPRIAAFRDQLTVSGKSFVSKLAGPMLRYAAELEKKTLLWGMDIPLCPSLMGPRNRSYHRFYRRRCGRMLSSGKRGAVRDDILRFGHFVSIEKQ